MLGHTVELISGDSTGLMLQHSYPVMGLVGEWSPFIIQGSTKNYLIKISTGVIAALWNHKYSYHSKNPRGFRSSMLVP